MDRKMFEAGLVAKKEEMTNEAHEEALAMDKDRDQLLSEMEEKKKKLAEIEGKPEGGKEVVASKRERTAAEKEKVAEWENFYKKYFPKMTIDFSTGEIPERTPEEEKEFTRLIVDAEVITSGKIFQRCADRFPSVTYIDDWSTVEDFVKRQSGIRFVWVRDVEAADEKHKNKSANMVENEGMNAETIRERMLHELKYFDETSDHLDKKTGTITASRDSSGHALIAFWNGGKFLVYWGSSGSRDDRWRFRQAVSSPTKSEK